MLVDLGKINDNSIADKVQIAGFNHFSSKDHRERFPKLVKMLYIKIKFNQMEIYFFLEIKLQWF